VLLLCINAEDHVPSLRCLILSLNIFPPKLKLDCSKEEEGKEEEKGKGTITPLSNQYKKFTNDP
jgi:hypothetical protein